jgi:hypothetical protein
MEEKAFEGTPAFKDFVQQARESSVEVTPFSDFIDRKRSAPVLPYLNESENAEVDKWVSVFEEECGNKLDNLDEGFFGKLLGAATGFVVGPTIGRIIANALGIERGVLYDMLTSRLVTTALGTAIAKSIGGEYKNKQ